ncbi:MAG TPA: nickel pincer cofactor biosynthesis protein LarB [Candidatus Kapabacteria bacterium]|nr:nickel pincer cofactor biosynthesis protein LarB [Candidatus Kapabacteria bacterium]
MNKEIGKRLQEFKKGALTGEELLRAISTHGIESLAFANVDHERPARQGFPEVIFCTNKTPQHVAEIAVRIAKSGHNVLATRATKEQFSAVRKKLRTAIFHDDARVITITVKKKPARASKYFALVVTAGTSDIPVAKEATLTIESFGHRAEMLVDVGVAGIHRLLRKTDLLRQASVIIVAAGMEGALPSVVGGLVHVPVIAVPTSIGYGAGTGGFAALFGMLNSCSSNVTVVNIDNGFGAGFVASTILNLLHSPSH